jgi:hypothetical protein
MEARFPRNFPFPLQSFLQLSDVPNNVLMIDMMVVFNKIGGDWASFPL